MFESAPKGPFSYLPSCGELLVVQLMDTYLGASPKYQLSNGRPDGFCWPVL